MLKKLLVGICAVLCLSTAAYGADILLQGATATGTGAEVKLGDVFQDHTVTCSFVDADDSITALTIVLQGSISPDSVAASSAEWFDLTTTALDAGELSAKKAMFHTTGVPVTRVRANLSVATGIGTGDTVNSYYVGE